jgi:hypothetical protein
MLLSSFQDGVYVTHFIPAFSAYFGVAQVAPLVPAPKRGEVYVEDFTDPFGAGIGTLSSQDIIPLKLYRNSKVSDNFTNCSQV